MKIISFLIVSILLISCTKSEEPTKTLILGKAKVVISGEITNQQAIDQINTEVGSSTEEIDVFNTTQLTSLNLDKVTNLKYLFFDQNKALINVSFKNLKKIENSFGIHNTNSLKEINFPTLENTNDYGTIKIDSNSNLTSITLGSLNSIYNLTIENNPKLNTLLVPVLKKVNTLAISSNSSLLKLELPKLETAITVSVTECNSFNSISFPLLKTCYYTRFPFCNLDDKNVNYILSRAIEFSPISTEVNLSQQNPSSPPTGQGIIDKDKLMVVGTNVYTD